eukprot:7889356-Heterocapsa_arctica.AAC.1
MPPGFLSTFCWARRKSAPSISRMASEISRPRRKPLCWSHTTFSAIFIRERFAADAMIFCE